MHAGTITIGRRGAALTRVGTAVLGTSRKTAATAAIPSFVIDWLFALFPAMRWPAACQFLAGLPGRVKPLLGSAPRMLCRIAIDPLDKAFARRTGQPNGFEHSDGKKHADRPIGARRVSDVGKSCFSRAYALNWPGGE
jgi:hypothetical protein